NAMRVLLSGNADIGLIGTLNVLASIHAGANIRAIHSWQPIGDYSLVLATGKGTKLADLAGKTFASSGPGGLPDQLPRLIMRKHGIDETSARFVQIGGHAARLQAVIGGATQGCARAALCRPRARQARHLSKEIARPMTNAPAASMVVYDGVSKFFPVRVRSVRNDRPELMVALDRINATVRKGELVTLLGPSGCGKTTLLRLTAGLIAADEGRITIAGVPVTGARKDACMVFQNFGLLPWRTVLGNVEFPLEIDGVGAAERREPARHFIALVGLAAFAEHFPHELSGGMQQRVGIARALMRKPILIFMDEPFGALDAQTREQLQEDFLAIWSHTGATVIFVTH